MCILWKENSKFKESKKAEMGVGTLIIFIAFLLVAAVAAGVLIQTAGSLQQKALSTGDEAEGQISTHALMIEVSAVNGSTGNLDNFTAMIKLAPGSNPIKLSDTIFTFNTQRRTGTLKYGGILGAAPHNTTQYTVEYLQQGTNYISGNLQRGDVIKMYFEGPESIGQDQEVRLNFIPKIGTETTVKFFSPDVISTERVYLYP